MTAEARRRRANVCDQQVQIAGIESPRPRWAEFDACFTPAPVVVQGLRWLASRIVTDGPLPLKLLDCCAGGGVFGQQARIVFPTARLLGAEPRVEEVEHAARHYDEFWTCPADELVARVSPRSVDIVSTNPPWWCWGDIFDAVWPLVRLGGLLAFLGPSSWGHSDEQSECIEIFDRVPPIAQLRVRGRIAYNGGRATDNRKCSWWVFQKQWRAADPSAGWTTITLPPLDVEQRCWTVRPGTERDE